MEVQVFYFEGCPNHRATVERLRQVLDDLGVHADVRETEVRDAAEARRLGFLGSPSVRVDGVDIDAGADASGDALSCRLYAGSGVPSWDLLERAIRSAAVRSETRVRRSLACVTGEAPG